MIGIPCSRRDPRSAKETAWPSEAEVMREVLQLNGVNYWINLHGYPRVEVSIELVAHDGLRWKIPVVLPADG